MKIQNIYRQGDVLIVRVSKIPKDAKPIKRDKGRAILAYGEITGHAHAIEDAHVKHLLFGDEMYLDLEKQAKVWHEDHNPKKQDSPKKKDQPMILAPGKYRVLHQMEFRRKELVRNID